MVKWQKISQTKTLMTHSSRLSNWSAKRLLATPLPLADTIRQSGPTSFTR
ncbi:DNA adenine methyltransferase [Klebsiella phage vB_KpnS-VAC11]|uniref:DNA adenine methyltransferase n=1 Tax=Klebsiella phage vB_KpnS-VAC11 TaxID=2864361 RepID=A0AAE7XII9_9CAUD|nr:DNA adenine methyltransferase [Klebsiella phage vB_KpnS-VAC11]